MIACASSFPVLAADAGADMGMKEGMMMMVSPDGQMHRMDAPDKMMSDMMMKSGKPMSGNMMMIMHNGKMMTMHDMKMKDGHMMSDMMMQK
jgi:hypothetical protein